MVERERERERDEGSRDTLLLPGRIHELRSQPARNLSAPGRATWSYRVFGCALDIKFNQGNSTGQAHNRSTGTSRERGVRGALYSVPSPGISMTNRIRPSWNQENALRLRKQRARSSACIYRVGGNKRRTN